MYKIVDMLLSYTHSYTNGQIQWTIKIVNEQQWV